MSGFGVSVKAHVNDAKKQLTRIQRKQLPFATSQALNDTAWDARKALRVQAVKKLDRPTKFTIDAFQIEKSSKRKLYSVVKIEEKRWKYLKYQVEGGTRRSSGRGIYVPVNVKLNRYGNIPGRSKRLVKGVNQFIGTIKGTTGVWTRHGSKRNKKLKLMVSFKSEVNYRKRFPFYNIVEGVVDHTFRKHFDKRIRAALRTAR